VEDRESVDDTRVVKFKTLKIRMSQLLVLRRKKSLIGYENTYSSHNGIGIVI
jgi:hypothetical protein